MMAGDVSTEEGFQYFKEGWYVEVQSFRKALDPDENVEMLKERFNGAETVHAKVRLCYGCRLRALTTLSGRYLTSMDRP
jgi:hypothetical protein